MKKITSILCFIILFSCLSSCKKEKNNFEKYEEIYNFYHPNGYIWETNWYEFESTTLTYDKDGYKKILEVRFVGRIQFNNDSFEGTTDKFIMECNEIEYFNEKNVIFKEMYDCYADGVWFSSTTEFNLYNNEKTIKTKGNSNVDDMTLKFYFDKMVFKPTQMRIFNNEYDYALFALAPDNMTFHKNYLKFEYFKVSYDYNKQNYMTEYFFDDNLKFREIKSVNRDFYYNGSEDMDIQHTAILKVSDEIDIYPRLDYDEVALEKKPDIYGIF